MVFSVLCKFTTLPANLLVKIPIPIRCWQWAWASIQSRLENSLYFEVIAIPKVGLDGLSRCIVAWTTNEASLTSLRHQDRTPRTTLLIQGDRWLLTMESSSGKCAEKWRKLCHSPICCALLDRLLGTIRQWSYDNSEEESGHAVHGSWYDLNTQGRTSLHIYNWVVVNRVLNEWLEMTWTEVGSSIPARRQSADR